MTGGGQERGRRAGTENVPLIAAMAKALELAEQERVEEGKRLRDLRDHLIGALLESIEGVRLTGAREKRLPNHVSIVVEGAEAEGMLIALDLAGIAASSGSACASGAHRPSHVLEAIGLPPHLAAGALRFSLGRSTTADDIDYLQKILPKIVQRVRT
jgi:cysteine desulfurase